MAGIPPLIGFFSKQLVLYSALQNGYYFISLLAIIVSVISCSYYLQIIKVLITPSESEGPIQINYHSFDPRLTPPRKRCTGGAPTYSYCAFKAGNKFKNKNPRSLNWSEGGLAQSKKDLLEFRFVTLARSEKNEILLTNTHSYLISTLTFTILLFFIKPSLILNSTQLLSLSLFYI